MTLVPAFNRHSRVGRRASILVVSATIPSRSGTLRSARSKTRVPWHGSFNKSATVLTTALLSRQSTVNDLFCYTIPLLREVRPGGDEALKCGRLDEKADVLGCDEKTSLPTPEVSESTQEILPSPKERNGLTEHVAFAGGA